MENDQEKDSESLNTTAKYKNVDIRLYKELNEMTVDKTIWGIIYGIKKKSAHFKLAIKYLFTRYDYFYVKEVMILIVTFYWM